MKYNIYCDESSHLKHSDNKVMTLGFICCERAMVKQANKDLRNLKEKHDLNREYEFKWTKVSKGKLSYYKELIDYFYRSDYLSGRVIIADKNELDYEKYSITHDEWYYRMYYLLLGKTLDEENQYNVFLDIKDTNSIEKLHKLKDVLGMSYYDFAGTMIENVQHIRSHEVELLQLADLIIGAVAYKNNQLNTSSAKLEIAEYISEKTGKVLTWSTSPSEKKLNIFKWRAGYRG